MQVLSRVCEEVLNAVVHPAAWHQGWEQAGVFSACSSCLEGLSSSKLFVVLPNEEKTKTGERKAQIDKVLECVSVKTIPVNMQG